MNPRVISALVLRYLFLYTRTPMRLVELITQSTLGFMQLQVSAAQGETDFSGGVSTFETLQSQLEALMARSNPTK